MAWKRGPMPSETWGWGAVALVSDSEPRTFFFADFHGEYVEIVGGADQGVKVQPHEIAYYDNSITLPPTGAKSRTGAA